MGFFKKKVDPLSDRARALSDKINALESEIKRLSTQQEERGPAPKWRSTMLPSGQSVPPPQLTREPVFEEIGKAAPPPEPTSTPDHYNELGVRKYDLAAAWRRIKNHFHGPPVNNPKLINYLAAGSVQGLRPLRYEKRVARNRFLVVLVVFLLFLFGMISFLVVNRP
jgi:hypothetical protein